MFGVGENGEKREVDVVVEEIGAKLLGASEHVGKHVQGAGLHLGNWELATLWEGKDVLAAARLSRVLGMHGHADYICSRTTVTCTRRPLLRPST